MASKCGHQVYLRYIKNIIIPPGVAARKGSSVHAGIEHDYKHKVEKGEYAPIDELLDVTNEKFRTLVKEEGVWLNKDDQADKENILNTALTESIASTGSYHINVAILDDKVALIEEQLTADIGIGTDISGKPDVVVDGKLRDIKTAGKRWPKGREEEEIQPVIYRMLIRENGYGDVGAEFCVLTNMKNGPKDIEPIWDNERKVCIDKREANTTPEYEQSVIERVRTVHQQFEAGIFPPAYPGSWWCSAAWCGYFSICKYAKGRKII
jgi:hypothetical protein